MVYIYPTDQTLTVEWRQLLKSILEHFHVMVILTTYITSIGNQAKGKKHYTEMTPLQAVLE